MWYVHYNTSTGECLGASALMKNIQNPLDAGTAVKEFEEYDSSPNAVIWNEDTVGFVPLPPSRLLSIGGFMNKLTLAERVLYYAARTDGVMTVKDALTGVRDMRDPIDMDDPVTATMLDLLVSDGVITAERKAEVLA